jgi:hypothetical protein
LKLPSLLDRPSLHFRPQRYKPRGVGYWSGHIPFACDLVATLRPSLFVELGTHAGESFFAFCQSIVECGVECQAVAIDTWRGDAHTGAYDESVYQEVNSYAGENYPSFTKLLRMTFDEALARFDDNLIDLLHVDGLHTYDAVRHDFDTWWPKVKPGGVVLLHDSFDRHDGFGVWKLLQELRTKFPASEFFHSHGLGIVIKPGGKSANHAAAEMVHASHDVLRNLRRYYEVCGGNLENEDEAAKRAPLAKWDVTSQLFWRDSHNEFSEGASVRVTSVIGEEVSEVQLVLPPATTIYTGFRLHLTLSFALLELQAIRILDRNEVELGRWSIPKDLIELEAAGLHAILTEDGSGALVLNAPLGCKLHLPVSDSTKAHLQREGGLFVICTKALNADSFTRKMAAAYGASETRHRKVEEGLVSAVQTAEHRAAQQEGRLAALEQPFLVRLLRRFREN